MKLASLKRAGRSARVRTNFDRQFELLEQRQLLSANQFTTDRVEIPAATGGINGYTPAQIRAAYGFNNVSFGSTAANGAGQTIAIIDAYNDPNIASDLAVFDAQFGIAAPPSLKIVGQNGSTSLPSTDPSQGWEGETALDVEWAHAIAPGANVLLVEANSASDSDLFAAVNYARQQAGVSVISMSWGSNDNAAYASYDQSLSSQYLVTPPGHQGVTFVASSGDWGVPSFPAVSPNVLAVGGTDLYLTSSGAISNETAWTPTTGGGQTWSGGGGVSTEFPGRKTPDVAYNAGVGVAVYDTFGPNHGWVSVGGTSAGAPQWAALVAIADQGRALNGLSTLNSATQTRAAIYAAPSSDFHDITSGSTQFQTATVGYDLATGLGSPVANSLIPYLANYGGSGGSGGGGTTTTTVPNAPATLSATALSTTQVSLSWTASTGATGYNIYEIESGTAVLLGAVTSGTTTTIGNLAAGTGYTFEVAAYNSAGTSGLTAAHVITQTATVAVTAPQNFKVVSTNSTTAQLSWNPVTGAAGYRVYEWNGSQAVQIGSTLAGTTTYTAGNQAANTTEYFYVTAYNASSSASTNWVAVAMPAAASLAAPVVTASATGTTTGTLTWGGVSGATGYAIYYWNGSRAVELGTVSSGTTSVTISGLTAGSTNYFTIVASNSTSSAQSNWVALTTPVTSAIKAADFVFAAYGSSSPPHAHRVF